MRKVTAEVSGHPELHTIELGCPEIPIVNFEGSIEAAKVFHCRVVTFVAAVSSRFGAIEIARAGVRATTSLDDGIERPAGISAVRLSGKHIAHPDAPKCQDDEPALRKEPFRYASHIRLPPSRSTDKREDTENSFSGKCNAMRAKFTTLEIAFVLVRLNQVACRIINADHSIM